MADPDSTALELAGTLVEIDMPKLSDAMEEATVITWLKRPGDFVTRGEPLVEVETDKATIVYEAETSGVLAEILVDDGGVAALGAAIARLRVETAGASAPVHAAAPAPAQAEPVPASVTAGSNEPRARATPVARRVAAELGVGLGRLDGSGPGGRIVRADVKAAAAAVGGAAQPSDTGAAAEPRGVVTRLPHTASQRTIAQRMSQSRATIPEFTLETDVAMDPAAALREDLRSADIDPLPSFNDLVVRSVALALRDFPALNGSYEDGTTLLFSRINVGIAVATDDSLVVPTIFDADARSVLELAVEARRLAARARDRKLSADEIAGSTFTVSNLGMFGVRRFDAVINPPQAAILAVGEVAARAVVEQGVVVSRTMMSLSLSSDHRVVNGVGAARFLAAVRHRLEHPALLLLDLGRK